MASSNVGLASTSLGNSLTRPGHAAVEVHSVDTNRRVVLDAEIDVFADTKTEVASLREVALSQFVFLDLQSTLQDFLGLWSTNCDVHSDLLVTTDTEGSDGVAGLAWKLELESAEITHGRMMRTVDGSLTAQLFQHLSSTGKSVTRLSDGDVKHNLLDAQLLHRVGGLLSGFGHFD